MAKLAKTPPNEGFTLNIDVDMLSMLHDCMKFVEGRGKSAFIEYLSNIYDDPTIDPKKVEGYTREFHQLIHEGMLKRAGVIPNE